MKVYSTPLGTEIFVLHRNYAPIAQGQSKEVPGVMNGCFSLFMILVLLTLLLLGTLGYRIVRNNQLAASRMTAQATVITKRLTVDSYDVPTHWYITYVFVTANKQQFKQESEITEPAYAELKEGARVTVRYDPNDPGNASPTEIVTVSTDPILIVIAFAFVALVLLSTPIVRSIRRRNARLRTGKIMLGTVDKVKTESDSDDDQVVTVDYHFSLPDGTTKYEGDHTIRNDLKQTDLPLTGTPLAIWYAPNVDPILL